MVSAAPVRGHMRGSVGPLAEYPAAHVFSRRIRIVPNKLSWNQLFVVVKGRNVFDIDLEFIVNRYDNIPETFSHGIRDDRCLVRIVDGVIVVEEAVVTALDKRW